MASSRHKTHKGREFNMAAFVDRNAETRAIGNVPMNARGDIVDSKGNVKVTAGQIAKGLSHVNDKRSKTVSIKEDSASKPKKSKKVQADTVVEEVDNIGVVEEPVVEDNKSSLSIVSRTPVDDETDEVEYSDGSMEIVPKER
ncbi:hypothetical protein N9V27_01095 [bacterium]|nr:hypothetical protein [bacterium]